jgi:hypothetical protein
VTAGQRAVSQQARTRAVAGPARTVSHMHGCDSSAWKPCRSPASRPAPAAGGVLRPCTAATSLLPSRGAVSPRAVAAADAAACGKPVSPRLLLLACPAAVAGTCRCWLPRTPPADGLPTGSSPRCTLQGCPCLTAAASLGEPLGLGIHSGAALRLRPDEAASLPSSMSPAASVLLLLPPPDLAQLLPLAASADDTGASSAAAGCSVAVARLAAPGAAALPTRSARVLKPAAGVHAQAATVAPRCQGGPAHTVHGLVPMPRLQPIVAAGKHGIHGMPEAGPAAACTHQSV